MRGLVKGGRNDGGVLTGDAVAGDVRAGKKFYNTDPLVYLTGNLTVRTGDNATTAITSAGTILKFKAPAGIYDGSADYVTYDDADYVAASIRYGKELFTLTGTYVTVTAGATVMASSSTTASSVSESYTAVKSCAMLWDGHYTISATFYGNQFATGGGTANLQIQKNGTAIATSDYTADYTAQATSFSEYFTAGSTLLWAVKTLTATFSVNIYDATIAVNGGFIIS